MMLRCGGMMDARRLPRKRALGRSLQRPIVSPPTPIFEIGFPRASQFRDNLAMCLAVHREATMRYATLVSTAIIAGILTVPALIPALAQGQLPRPGKDAPPPQGQ